jgi:hypothetical protein
MILDGNNVVWTYLVFGNGRDVLTNVLVLDDFGTPNDPNDDFMPVYVSGDRNNNGRLDRSETWLYTSAGALTVSGSPVQFQAEAGLVYVNRATVTATIVGETRTTSDDDFNWHEGVLPRVQIEKFIHAPALGIGPEDADNAPGVLLPVGTSVFWTYKVANNGNEPLVVDSVRDNAGTSATSDDFLPKYVSGDTDGDGLLDPDEVWTYTSEGATTVSGGTFAGYQVVAGQYTNTATVLAHGQATNMSQTDFDRNNHLGAVGDVHLEKRITAPGLATPQDADTPMGPVLKVGTPVTWIYEVTAPLANTAMTVTDIVDDAGTPNNSGDDFRLSTGGIVFVGGDANNNGLLDPGESWRFESRVSYQVVAGQYTNKAVVTAAVAALPQITATDDDPNNHFGTTADVTLEKLISTPDLATPLDADNPSGPKLPIGSPVTWIYQVSNSGGETLTVSDIVDDAGTPNDASDDFRLSTGGIAYVSGDGNNNGLLDVGETWEYRSTISYAVRPGQYSNKATVTAVSTVSQITVDDDDTNNHFGAIPAIHLEKLITADVLATPQDADAPTGPVLSAGTIVNWIYEVTNPGNVALQISSIVDDAGDGFGGSNDFSVSGGQIVYVSGDANSNNLLDPGETWRFRSTVNHIVQPGQYSNEAVVTGVVPDNTKLTASDDDLNHHFGRLNEPAIDIETFVKGFVPTTPMVEGRMTGGGSAFTVDGMRVTHGFELHCNINIGPNNLEINFNGNSFHLEQLVSAVCLETDLDQSPGPLKNAPFDTYIGVGYGRFNGYSGYLVEFTFTDAGEPGTSDLMQIKITGLNGETILYVSNTLEQGNHQTHRENKKVDGNSGSVVMTGADFGDDADTPTGPYIPAGNRVDFTYVVTNTGNTPLANVVVTDDNGTPNDTSDDFAPLPMLQNGFNIGDLDQDNILDLDETWLYEASIPAVAGQRNHVSSVTGTPVNADGNPTGQPAVDDNDPTHYFGALPPMVRVEKLISSASLSTPLDADTGPGPFLPVGESVTWTYQVHNEGNLPLLITNLRDDFGTATSADDFTPVYASGDTNGNELVDPTEVWTFTSANVSYQVVAGQYTNHATVSAIIPGEPGVVATDSDPNNHFGFTTPSVRVEKAINAVDPNNPTSLEDADGAPVPSLLVGTNVVWTYQVFNQGNTPLTITTIKDDFGTPSNLSDDFDPKLVSGDANSNNLLDPGEVWLYTSAGVRSYQVKVGQYTNLVRVTAESTMTTSTLTDDDPNTHKGQTNSEGLTPGFWKNNADHNNAVAWPRDNAGNLIYQPGATLESLFDVPDSLGVDSTSLAAALDFNSGGEFALLRHAVAGVLNATHPALAYPLTASQVIAQVNSALASGHNGTINNLKNQLDQYNNRGGDLDQHGNFGGQNLVATSAPAATALDGAMLTEAELAPIVVEAISRWSSVTGGRSLAEVQVAIVDLPNDSGDGTPVLGHAVGNTVMIDFDAGGFGWFIDATPADDAEFVPTNSSTELVASATSPAVGGMDLLTVVMHELGHVFGLEDLDSEIHGHDLMTGAISVGIRRLPTVERLAVSSGENETVGESTSPVDESLIVHVIGGTPVSLKENDRNFSIQEPVCNAYTGDAQAKVEEDPRLTTIPFERQFAIGEFELNREKEAFYFGSVHTPAVIYAPVDTAFAEWFDGEDDDSEVLLAGEAGEDFSMDDFGKWDDVVADLFASDDGGL